MMNDCSVKGERSDLAIDKEIKIEEDDSKQCSLISKKLTPTLNFESDSDSTSDSESDFELESMNTDPNPLVTKDEKSPKKLQSPSSAIPQVPSSAFNDLPRLFERSKGVFTKFCTSVILNYSSPADILNEDESNDYINRLVTLISDFYLQIPYYPRIEKMIEARNSIKAKMSAKLGRFITPNTQAIGIGKAANFMAYKYEKSGGQHYYYYRQKEWVRLNPGTYIIGKNVSGKRKFYETNLPSEKENFLRNYPARQPKIQN